MALGMSESDTRWHLSTSDNSKEEAACVELFPFPLASVRSCMSAPAAEMRLTTRGPGTDRPHTPGLIPVPASKFSSHTVVATAACCGPRNEEAGGWGTEVPMSLARALTHHTIPQIRTRHAVRRIENMFAWPYLPQQTHAHSLDHL